MNKNSFSQVMATKTTAELENITKEQSQYDEEAVDAAIWELEKRKTEEGKSVEPAPPQEQQKRKKSNYTDAPLLYPKWSIWVISVLFTPLFGGIMMAMNFKRAEKPKQVTIVLAFSVIFTIVAFLSADFIQSQSSTSRNWTNLINIMGAVVLGQYFWNVQIGETFKYRKRSPLLPFIISIAIATLILWAAFLDVEEGPNSSFL